MLVLHTNQITRRSVVSDALPHLALSASFEYLCYGSTAIITVFRRQILTSYKRQILTSYKRQILTSYKRQILTSYKRQILTSYKRQILTSYKRQILTSYKRQIMTSYKRQILTSYKRQILTSYKCQILTSYKRQIMTFLNVRFRRVNTEIDEIVWIICSGNLIFHFRRCLFVINKHIFRHLKLEIASLIPVSNE